MSTRGIVFLTVYAAAVMAVTMLWLAKPGAARAAFLAFFLVTTATTAATTCVSAAFYHCCPPNLFGDDDDDDDDDDADGQWSCRTFECGFFACALWQTMSEQTLHLPVTLLIVLLLDALDVEVVNRLKRFPKQVRIKTLRLLASFLGHEL